MWGSHSPLFYLWLKVCQQCCAWRSGGGGGAEPSLPHHSASTRSTREGAGRSPCWRGGCANHCCRQWGATEGVRRGTAQRWPAVAISPSCREKGGPPSFLLPPDEPPRIYRVALGWGVGRGQKGKDHGNSGERPTASNWGVCVPTRDISVKSKHGCYAFQRDKGPGP